MARQKRDPTGITGQGLGSSFSEFFRGQGDDDSYIEQLGRGLTKVPGKAQEFLSQDIGDIAEDVTDFGVAFGQEVAKQAKENPLKFVAETFTPYGYAVSAKETRDLLEQADTLRAQGQVEQAEGLEALSTVALLDLVPGGRLFRKAADRMGIESPIPPDQTSGFPIPEPGKTFKSGIETLELKQSMRPEEFQNWLKNQPKKFKEQAQQAAKEATVTRFKKGKESQIIDKDKFKDALLASDFAKDIYATEKPGQGVMAGFDNPHRVNQDLATNYGNQSIISVFRGPESVIKETGMRRTVLESLFNDAGPVSQFLRKAADEPGTGGEELDRYRNLDLTPEKIIEELRQSNLEGLNEVYRPVVEQILDTTEFKNKLKEALYGRRVRYFNDDFVAVPRLLDLTEGSPDSDEFFARIRNITEEFDQGASVKFFGANERVASTLPLFSRKRDVGLSPQDAAAVKFVAEKEGLTNLSTYMDEQVGFLTEIYDSLNKDPAARNAFDRENVAGFENVRDSSRDLLPELTGEQFDAIYKNTLKTLKENPTSATALTYGSGRAFQLAFNKIIKNELGYIDGEFYSTGVGGPVNTPQGLRTGGTGAVGDVGTLIGSPVIQSFDSSPPGIPVSESARFYSEAIDDVEADVIGLTTDHSEFAPSSPFVQANHIGFARSTDNFVFLSEKLKYAFDEDDIGKDILVDQQDLPRSAIRGDDVNQVDTSYTGPTDETALVLPGRHISEYQPDIRGSGTQIGSYKEVEQGREISMNMNKITGDDARLRQQLFRDGQFLGGSFEKSAMALDEIINNIDLLIDNRNVNVKKLNNLHITAVKMSDRGEFFGREGDRRDAPLVVPLVFADIRKTGVKSQYQDDIQTVKDGLEDFKQDFEELASGNLTLKGAEAFYKRFLSTERKLGDNLKTRQDIRKAAAMRFDDPTEIGRRNLDSDSFFGALERLNYFISRPGKRTDPQRMKNVVNYFTDERILNMNPVDVEKLYDPDLLLGDYADSTNVLSPDEIIARRASETRMEPEEGAEKTFFQNYEKYISAPEGANEIFPGYIQDETLTKKKLIKGSIISTIRNQPDARAIASPAVRRDLRDTYSPELDGPDDELNNAINPKYIYTAPSGGNRGPFSPFGNTPDASDAIKPQVYRELHKVHQSVVAEINADLPWAEKGVVPEGKPRFYADILPTGRIDYATKEARGDRNKPLALRVRPVIRWDKEAADVFKDNPMTFKDGGLVSLPKMAPGLEPLLRKYRREGTLSHFI